MKRIGYARVSTVDQDPTGQEERLRAVGCAIVCSETASGGSRDGRTELERVLQFIGSGDELVVVKLDRLGRSTRDVLNLVHELDGKGAALVVLEPAFSTRDAAGILLVTVLGMVAEMERRFIRERQRAGIDAAKARGTYRPGRSPIEAAAIRGLLAEGLGPSEVARRLGCSRMTVYRARDEAGA